MSLYSTILTMVAQPLKLRRRHQPRRSPPDPRILVIRRNRMGDMIYTLPLLHALRRLFPQAHITVACDPRGEAIALACPAVNDVIVLARGWNPIQAAFKNAAHLQDYDWVIAAKGGFDRRLALLARLTNAVVRIGFERRVNRPSAYYTDPVDLPEAAQEEHQIDTLLRLLRHVGLLNPKDMTAINLTLQPPESALEFAAATLAQPPFSTSPRFMLINMSSTVRLKFSEEEFITLAKRILSSTDLAIGLVSAPDDRQKTHEIALCMGSRRIVALDTEGPMELAALLNEAAFIFTPEGGAAHLAAAMRTPALVLWSEGPFKKWHSRSNKHFFIHAEPGEKSIPVERVWIALQPLLTTKRDEVEQAWAELLEESSPSNPTE